VRDTAAGKAGLHVGVGYALTGLLRAARFLARADRQFIPADIAARAGLDWEDYRALRNTSALRVASAEIAAAALRHLDSARSHRSEIPRSALPALLPAIIARHSLMQLRRARYDPFDPALAVPDARQSWRLAAAVLLNRF
jgi:phytoene synthase